MNDMHHLLEISADIDLIKEIIFSDLMKEMIMSDWR